MGLWLRLARSGLRFSGSWLRAIRGFWLATWPYDFIEVRLAAADVVIFLDLSVWKCAWRAIKRSRERMDFWMWLLRYRWVSRPFLMKAISEHASGANVYVLRDSRAVERFLDEVAAHGGK
jgi:hypothetical protein